MKKISIMFVSLLLVSLSTTSYAVPTLSFNGNISYDAVTQGLSMDGYLTGSANLSSAITTGLGSNVTFSATLDSFGSLPNSNIFGVFSGALLDVFDANNAFLLGGALAGLTMVGADGALYGAVSGNVIPTSGSLIGDFDPSQLLALELNMSAPFSATMFDSSFTAQLTGTITSIAAPSVPEPQTLALFGLGLLMVTGLRRFVR